MEYQKQRLMMLGMLGKSFFTSADEKAEFCAEDAPNGYKLYTSSGVYCTLDFAYWKDSLEHRCHPLENYIHTWPNKPADYRKIIGPYTVEMRELGLRILDMIYEGLGHMDKEFDKHELRLAINYYPACPDPSLALGSGEHCDSNLITIIQQDVPGLQLLKDGEWIGVEPLPNALVISTNLTLEVISNGKLKSAVHRVVTNSACSRTSLVNFLSCARDGIVKPAESLVSPSNPPLFRAFQYKELDEVLLGTNSDFKATLEYFKIPS